MDFAYESSEGKCDKNFNSYMF